MVQPLAYHEAGHAVIAARFGAEVMYVTLEPDWDDGPRRDGDAAIRWHHRGQSRRALLQKELLAVLAGPLAEMIYEDGAVDPFLPLPWDPDGSPNPADVDPRWLAEWSADGQLAWHLATQLAPQTAQAAQLIRAAVGQLLPVLESDAIWQAVAEVADQLDAYQTVEGAEVQECLQRWT